MAGQVKKLIDKIIDKKAMGVPALISITRSKMIMKGVIPKDWNASSPDDPVVLGKLKIIAAEFGITDID